MKKIETVFVNREGVKVMINKSDLKASDKLWSDAPVRAASSKKGTAK
jgi:hypothetical protein